MRIRLFFIILLLLSACPGFTDSAVLDLSSLDDGSYICLYEEKYYDGLGESSLTIKTTDDGYFVVWKGITDITEVYTDSNFNTLEMRITDEDTELRAVREGRNLLVKGVDKGKTINKTLTINAENWFQLLPASMIPFVLSDEEDRKFSMFDPYNIQVMDMIVEKHENSSITVLGEEYPVVRLTMRMQGLLSLFWKSEIWCSRESGLQVKYEGLNVIPKFYTAVISLKKIELLNK